MSQFEYRKEPMFPIASRYGAIAGLLLIVFALLFHFSGMTDYEDPSNSGGAGWLSLLINLSIVVGALFLAIKELKKQQNGWLTLGQGFGVGTLAGLVSSLMLAVWTYLFFTLVEPDLLNIILEASLAQIEEQGQSEEVLEQSRNMAEMMINPLVMSLGGMVFYVISSMVIALIGGLIFKSDT